MQPLETRLRLRIDELLYERDRQRALIRHLANLDNVKAVKRQAHETQRQRRRAELWRTRALRR